MRSLTKFITHEEGLFCSHVGIVAKAGTFNTVKNGMVDPDVKTVFFYIASGVKYL